MANLITDLGIVQEVLGDISAFAAGKVVSTTQTIEGTTFTASVQVLPSGPVAPFQELGGSFFQILALIFADYAAFSSGAPIAIAEKIGATWYGTSIVVQGKSPA